MYRRRQKGSGKKRIKKESEKRSKEKRRGKERGEGGSLGEIENML